MARLINQRGSPFITEMFMADAVFEQRQSTGGFILHEKAELARHLYCVFTFIANLDDGAGVSQRLGD